MSDGGGGGLILVCCQSDVNTLPLNTHPLHRESLPLYAAFAQLQCTLCTRKHTLTSHRVGKLHFFVLMSLFHTHLFPTRRLCHCFPKQSLAVSVIHGIASTFSPPFVSVRFTPVGGPDMRMLCRDPTCGIIH